MEVGQSEGLAEGYLLGQERCIVRSHAQSRHHDISAGVYCIIALGCPFTRG